MVTLVDQVHASRKAAHYPQTIGSLSVVEELRTVDDLVLCPGVSNDLQLVLKVPLVNRGRPVLYASARK